jgi:Ethylbenzene dehydrogenase
VLYAHPAVVGTAVACAFASLALGIEFVTRPSLRIIEIAAAEAPVLDGDLSDGAWLKAPPATVMTTQGGDFGATGESIVEVRAVHDGVFAYFAFVWTDPTRSLKHLPLIKTQGGWELVATDHTGADETRFHEDKFSVLFARASFPLIGAAIHLSSAPMSDRPASSTGRGLHYMRDGSIADVWVWRASHAGPNGHVDNCHFGGATEPTSEQAEGRRRYRGGFALDPGPVAHHFNGKIAPDGVGGPRLRPWRLPRDIVATMRALGHIGGSAEQSEPEGARWWMSESESIPYSKPDDDKIPVGTIIPGIVMPDMAESHAASVRGVARWAAGRWTLEVARRLYTGSSYDLPIKTGTLMWVAAFDHSQTRHTRHLRPLRLEVE